EASGTAAPTPYQSLRARHADAAELERALQSAERGLDRTRARADRLLGGRCAAGNERSVGADERPVGPDRGLERCEQRAERGSTVHDCGHLCRPGRGRLLTAAWATTATLFRPRRGCRTAASPLPRGSSAKTLPVRQSSSFVGFDAFHCETI